MVFYMVKLYPILILLDNKDSIECDSILNLYTHTYKFIDLVF